jgi:hypothetical protein
MHRGRDCQRWRARADRTLNPDGVEQTCARTVVLDLNDQTATARGAKQLDGWTLFALKLAQGDPRKPMIKSWQEPL